MLQSAADDVNKTWYDQRAAVGKSGHPYKAWTRIGNVEDVNMDVLCKGCSALDCRLPDIIEIVPDDLLSDNAN